MEGVTDHSLVVLYWDYLLTLSDEIKFYWQGTQKKLSWTPLKLSWTPFFFFLNRYLAIFGHIPVMVEFFAKLPEKVGIHVPCI